MHQHSPPDDRALAPISLPGPDGQPPLAVAYTDKHRSLAVTYPHPQKPEPPQPEPQGQGLYLKYTPIHPLVVAIAIFLVGLGVAIPIAMVGALVEGVSVEAPAHD
jgi:hypothetical protein